jgi:hypothetical protein
MCVIFQCVEQQWQPKNIFVIPLTGACEKLMSGAGILPASDATGGGNAWCSGFAGTRARRPRHSIFLFFHGLLHGNDGRVSARMSARILAAQKFRQANIITFRPKRQQFIIAVTQKSRFNPL